jgi:putative transcriptional regulator
VSLCDALTTSLLPTSHHPQRTGETKGTPIYCAPEMLAAEGSEGVARHSRSTDMYAFGIVINKPLTLLWGEVLDQMQLPPGDPVRAAQPVLCGGPVYPDRGFVVHRSGGTWASTHPVSEQVQVTTSRDILLAMAQGDGPPEAFLALGHAGWEAGQLERELLDNAWLTLPLNEALLFELEPALRWEAAWKLLGIDAGQVSLTPGHA